MPSTAEKSPIDETSSTARAASPWWRRWPAWIAYVAGAWSLMYSALGVYWSLGGAGFPFGVGDYPAATQSVLAGVNAQSGAPVIAGMGLLGATVALTMVWGQGRGFPRMVLLVFAWSIAVGLALVLPDYRVLMGLAYMPILLLGAPFGWPPGLSFLDAFPWPVINQVVCIGGGLLWAATAVAYGRRTRGACGNCGRIEADAADWTTPDAAARWGRWAVYAAVIIPLLYATTRWAWALGIPLGISEEFLRAGQETGQWWAGAALATLAVGGALLTLGLIQRWGEIFPRWMPLLSGRRVPPAMAIVPASLVAVLVTTAGLMIVRLILFGAFGPSEGALTLDENWAALAPELPWPLWGAALGAATLAYYYRRRGTCKHCGRS